jgi:hypothetical protein
MRVCLTTEEHGGTRRSGQVERTVFLCAASESSVLKNSLFIKGIDLSTARIDTINPPVPGAKARRL